MTTTIDTLTAASAERSKARRENWRLLRKRPSFIIGSLIALFWLVCAVFGDSLTPHNPLTYTTKTYLTPRRGNWFGTDEIGRDVFSRVIAGARDVLLVAPPAAVLGVVLGTIIGMVMGYRRGWLDLAFSRIVEASLALPLLLVGLLIVTIGKTSPVLQAITLHNQKLLLILVVALLFTPIVARTVRAAVITERDLDYVTSAKLRGESGLFIMSREILPNIMGPIIVELTVRIGYAIFTLSTLSFLGAGIQRPTPDWGLLIADGRSQLRAGYWWPVTFPALAIATLVIAVNLIADSIQAVYDR
jgi:peptide/nickel transport system permease protein